MRAKEINIDQFKTINDLYTFIDENAFDLERDLDLTDLWVLYRNHTLNEEEKVKVQWEIDFSFFDLKGSHVFSQAFSTGEKIDEIKKYPDINEIQNSVLSYLYGRAVSSQNPLLRARYYHLLWKCPSGIKKNTYALSAIDNYITAINDYYNLYKKDNHKGIPTQIVRKYENLVAISNEVKSDKSKLSDLTNFLLYKAPKLEFYTRHIILDKMLEYPKLFKPNDFENTLSFFDDEIKRCGNESVDFLLVKYYLPSAINIATKLKSDTKRWYNEIGTAYLRIANGKTEEEENWIKLDIYAEAITAFKLAGNNEKRKETEYLYAELKPQVKLSSFSVEFDEETRKKLQEKDQYIKKLAGSILLKPSNEIYKLIAGGFFFPKYNEVVYESNSFKKSFLDSVTTIHIDSNKNLTKHSKETEDNRKIYEAYSYLVKENILPYLYYIFIPGIKSGHLTIENFISYITEYTWIGKPFTKYDLGGEKKSTNWIGHLAPAVIEFFIQIQAWGSSKHYTPCFVLCVDSLTLKIEGLLRNFCERVKIPTSVSRNNKMEEIYIHNVLENEILKKYYNEDDLLLLNYMFANEGGLNLRNKIAHCFYDYSDYSVDKILLLIAALLRIGKHNFKEK